MQRGNAYTFIFAFIVCICCSVALAFAATGLREAQDISARLDIVKNILLVGGYEQKELDRMAAESPQQVLEIFRKNFDVRLVNEDKEEVPLEFVKSELNKIGYQDEQLAAMQAFEIVDIFKSKVNLLAKAAGQSVDEYNPGLSLIYLQMSSGEGDAEREVVAYIIPVEGYGLWDMVYAYLALEADLVTVKDVVFYSHQETPGLGGEISTKAFTDQWKGKKILDENGDLVSIQVVKGGTDDDNPHGVDGISGGTITGDSVTKFLKEDLERYNAYFKTIRGGDKTGATQDQAAFAAGERK